jgi:predicted nucleic acid-binding protein
VRTAIDTNVISALWSGEATAAVVKNLLDEAAERGGLVICPVAYVELRAFPRATASYVDSFLDETGIVADWTFDEAIWQLAAERYERCTVRKRKQKMGEPKRLIADFIVGAHALLRADELSLHP